LKLATVVLMHMVLQRQLLVLVGSRSLMLLVLVGKGLLVVVALVMVVPLQLLVLVGGKILMLLGKGL
jgi:hypothetical protein